VIVVNRSTQGFEQERIQTRSQRLALLAATKFQLQLLPGQNGPTFGFTLYSEVSGPIFQCLFLHSGEKQSEKRGFHAVIG
jgi:hypothetical protein